MYNNREYEITNITGATTTTVFSGKGILGRIVVNAVNGGGTITINDTGSPTVAIATITLNASPFTVPLEYNARISGGLQIVTSQSPNITVLWAKG